MRGLIVALNHSTDAPDRAMVSLRAARAIQKEGYPLLLWMAGEGVRLGVQGVAETFREPGPESAAEIMDALVAGGVKVWLENQSFEDREFDYDAVRPGVEVVPPTRLARLLGEGWTPVGI